MEHAAFRKAVEADIREHELIEPGGAVTCLVSGGADSTCLWHVLRELGYRVSALHVTTACAGAESDEDAAFCRDVSGPRSSTAAAGAPRTSCATSATRSRPTGCARRATPPPTRSRPSSTASSRAAPRARSTGAATTASSARSSTAGATRPRRTASPRASTSAATASNPGTKRGLIRDEILPLLRRLHPAAEGNLLRLGGPQDARRRSSSELLDSIDGSTRLDLGGGTPARPRVRPRLARALPCRPRSRGALGPWRITADEKGLKVRGWRPGDRLAGRTKKIQDVFVDAKVPAVGARGLAARRARRRGRRRARDRRGAKGVDG